MLQLAPHVFLAPVRERAVVLDLRRDKYFALGPAMAQAAFELVGARPTADRDEALEAARSALMVAGILTERPSRPPDRRAETPTRTLWPSDYAAGALRPLRPAAFLGIMWALTQAWLALRLLRFGTTIGWITQEKTRRTRSAACSEQDALDHFFTARPWFPAKPICRLDALALCVHLRRNGHAADLVFGVKLERFGAHCWVQSGDRVLNEPHEKTLQFTPIMVV